MTGSGRLTDTTDPTGSYRIEYSIEFRAVGDDQYREIGFGGTGGWKTIAEALYEASSAIQNDEYEGVGR